VAAIQHPETKSSLPNWLLIVVFGRNLKWTLLRVVIWGVVCVFIFRVAFLHIEVTGISMLPTYPDNSTHWISRLAYLWQEPQRGDTVAIRLAGPHVMYLKRIIGLPGESVAFVNGRVLINGEILDEPYLKLPCDWNHPPETVGPDKYFVVGDNRSMRELDHEHGECERARILGKVVL
jgi:signal peptidase I